MGGHLLYRNLKLPTRHHLETINVQVERDHNKREARNNGREAEKKEQSEPWPKAWSLCDLRQPFPLWAFTFLPV